ncbi:MAG: hypothetical protein WC247_15395 [Porticoccaceae bacterium]
MPSTDAPTFEYLEELVRYGLEPDDPGHLKAYIQLGAARAEGSAVEARARVYKEMFAILVEAIYDDCVPFHWRCLCLDHCHQPLSLMRAVAVTERQKSAVLAIQQELSSLARYFLDCRRQASAE